MNGIATPTAYQPMHGGGYWDCFFAKFSKNGTRRWGTYYGGSEADDGGTCTLDASHFLYIGGSTASINNVTTPGCFQSVYGGGLSDALMAKFCIPPDSAVPITGPVSVCKGSYGVSYSVPAVDYALGYTWHVPQNAVLVNGQNSTTILVAYPPAAVTGRLTVWAYNQCGDGDSTYIYVNLHDPPIPEITGPDTVCTEITSQYFTQGGKSQYTWNYPSGGNIVSGGSSTDSSLTIIWTTPGLKNVTVTFFDGCFPLIPSQFNTWVIDRTTISVSITASSNNICAGTPMIFNATPTNPGSSPIYQWKVNGVNTGSNSPVLIYTPDNGDQVHCVLTSSITNCTSNNPALSKTISMVVYPTLPVGVTISVSANSVCSGTLVTFTAVATNGGLTPSFQWKVNGLNAGTNSPTFTYSPADGDQIAILYTSSFVICTSNNPATSNIITMVVNQLEPVSVSVLPSLNTVCAGTTVNFTAIPINGGTTPQYQWKVNGLIAGTNSPNYSYYPVNGDAITCTLTSDVLCPSGNPATSTAVVMVVNPLLPVGISIVAFSNPFCAGSSVTFTATPVNGGTSPAFQWKVNAVNANNANNASYAYNAVNGDGVTCEMASNLGCVIGNPATSSPIAMIERTSPQVTFTACFDTITMVIAKPIKLKGGVPPGGQYSGPGVNSVIGVFNPSEVGTGLKTISYAYTNVYTCSAQKTRTILVQPAPAFICGNNLTDIRDNKVYATALIGTQCWMQENLDFGITIDDFVPQTDNCVAEKYTDHSSFVTRHSSFYQWDELMQYQTAEGSQGLCPPGWHVPTSVEWDLLVLSFNGPGQAGGPMKDTLLVNGFHSMQQGFLYLNHTWAFATGLFAGSMYWSSTLSGSSTPPGFRAIARGLNEYNPSASKYEALRANAFAVRCLKD